MDKDKKCEFDKKGYCHALVCYSSQKCNARDKNGNPKYRARKPEKMLTETRKGYTDTELSCAYNQAIDDYEAWLKELIPKEKEVPECLNDASVGDYEIGFNDAITEIKKKLTHRR